MDSHFHRQLRRFRPRDKVERCALILGGNPTSLREVDNTHESPRTSFRISRAEAKYVAVETGRPIVGVLHTHPDPSWSDPSPLDLAAALARPDLKHCIYQPASRRLVWYDAKGITGIEHVPATWLPTR